MPLTLLATSLLNPKFFSVTRVLGLFAELPTLFGQITIYLLFIIILEVILRLFDFLIESGINVREAFHKDSIKAQLRLADKLGVKLALILGQKEAQEEMILVRNMKDGVQEMIKISKIVDEIKKQMEVILKGIHENY